MEWLNGIVRTRLVVAVVAGIAGAVIALAVAGAGDWRDVVLVLVTGALTLIASEATGEREARRQAVARAEEREQAAAREALTGELALDAAILATTSRYVFDVMTLDLYVRGGFWDRAEPLLAKVGADPFGDQFSPDLRLIVDQALHDQFLAALLDSQAATLEHRTGKDTRRDSATQVAIAQLAAELKGALREQERLIASRRLPLRRQEPGAKEAEDRVRAIRNVEELFNMGNEAHEAPPPAR